VIDTDGPVLLAMVSLLIRKAIMYKWNGPATAYHLGPSRKQWPTVSNIFSFLGHDVIILDTKINVPRIPFLIRQENRKTGNTDETLV